MEEQYWNRFAKTGKVKDYLEYRGITICEQIMHRYEGEKSLESDYGDRHGDRIDAYWRI